MKANKIKSKKLIPQTPFIKEASRPELIAPAGSLEKMKTAFAFGADAVYLGIPDFSLRVRINDFTIAGVREAVKYAHLLNKKVYVTLNIFAHNKHIKKLPAYVRELKKIKPDGLIISDPGIMSVVKKIWPSARIHLSTQANCTNWSAADFWFKQGLKRIVLGRETTLDEIKEIRKRVPKLEIETFVHGAMCMAYSGRCFLSKFYTGRSANLGDCVQPCRWEYYIKAKGHDEVLELVEEKHGSYILNSNDMCLIKRLPELIGVGINSFKIEGRAKSVYYLACVIGAYRKAIDNPSKKNLDSLYKELNEKLFHRGYTEGFMFGERKNGLPAGRQAQNLDNSHQVPIWEFCGQGIGDGKIKVHNSLKIGDIIEIITPNYDIIKMKIKTLIDAKTGEKIEEAHGGQKRTVFIEANRDIPEYSVIRRKI